MTLPMPTPLRARTWAPPLAVALVLAGCAGSAESRENLLGNLHKAMEHPVDSEERSRSHSRLVQDVVDSDLLSNMSRAEVREAIGQGSDCSRHPKCAEQGFEGDDWFYHVGGSGGAPVPILIVGFDHTGHVTRTWYMKTH